MKNSKLAALEKKFLLRYPGGFDNPELMAIGKKHQVTNRVKQAQEFFHIDRFSSTLSVVEHMLKLISRSSLISLYEKPRLKDWVKLMTPQEQESYALSLKDMLHGDQEYGFNVMLDLLLPGKLAKWSLMTILPYYFAPHDEVFVKPTTTKKILQYFCIDDLVYKPKPSFDFYLKYRQEIINMRKNVEPSLQHDNAAFCGFLMMSISCP